MKSVPLSCKEGFLNNQAFAFCPYSQGVTFKTHILMFIKVKLSEINGMLHIYMSVRGHVWTITSSCTDLVHVLTLFIGYIL